MSDQIKIVQMVQEECKTHKWVKCSWSNSEGESGEWEQCANCCKQPEPPEEEQPDPFEEWLEASDFIKEGGLPNYLRDAWNAALAWKEEQESFNYDKLLDSVREEDE